MKILNKDKIILKMKMFRLLFKKVKICRNFKRMIVRAPQIFNKCLNNP